MARHKQAARKAGWVRPRPKPVIPSSPATSDSDELDEDEVKKIEEELKEVKRRHKLLKRELAARVAALAATTAAVAQVSAAHAGQLAVLDGMDPTNAGLRIPRYFLLLLFFVLY